MCRGLTNTLIIHILNNAKLVHNYTSIYTKKKKEVKRICQVFSSHYQVLLDNSSLAFEDFGSNINVLNIFRNSAEYR